MRDALSSWGTRIRTEGNSAVAGSPAGDDARKDAHGGELGEVVRGWAKLPPPLRAAVLALVRAGGCTENGTVENATKTLADAQRPG